MSSEKKSRGFSMKYIGILVVVIAIIVALAGAWLAGFLTLPTAPPTKDKITIGWTMSATGWMSAFTTTQRNTYNLWVEQVNDNGGIYVKEYGKNLTIQTIEYDDRSDPLTAIKMYEKLITEDKVDLVFPPWATVLHMALIPTFEKYGYPVVGNTANPDAVFEQSVHYYFQQCTSLFVGKGWADWCKYLWDNGTIKSVAGIYATEQGTIECFDSFGKYMEIYGIPVQVKKSYPLGITDLTPLLQEVKSVNPDVLIASSYPADGTLMVQQMIELGLKPNLTYIWVGPIAPAFYEKFTTAELDGVCASGGGSGTSPNSPTGGDFWAAYKAKYGIYPDNEGVLSYVTCQVMQQALEKAGTLNNTQIRDTIATAEFQTIGGTVKFDGKQYLPPAYSAAVVQWQNGVVQQVWPLENATAELEYPKIWP